MKKRAGDEGHFKQACQQNRTMYPISRATNHAGKNSKMASPRANHTPIGTFKNLSIHFPEGSVINLRFLSERSNVHSEDDGEEIYRLMEIGLGLELMGQEAEVTHKSKVEFMSVSGWNITVNG